MRWEGRESGQHCLAPAEWLQGGLIHTVTIRLKERAFHLRERDRPAPRLLLERGDLPERTWRDLRAVPAQFTDLANRPLPIG